MAKPTKPGQPGKRPAAQASHELRIVGGQWRRSLLPVADKPGLRPTPDRVRETLFNWLGQDLDGWRVLDAFAGSGALGFEAASRGAASAVLLERDLDLVRSLNASRERLKATQLQVLRADALVWMRTAAAQSFELVLLDPPFDANLAWPALQAAARLVVAQGFVYLESGAPLTEAELAQLPGLRLHRQGKAGAVHYHLLQASAPAAD